jgi:hypothetical protein
MGCGTSTDAAAAGKYALDPVGTSPMVAATPLRNSGVETASASAAGVSPAEIGNTATMITDSAVGSAAPGELLLGVAEHLPFVAPVAFLIGAVIAAAQSAKTLKADAAEFSKFVSGAEAVCQQAAAQGSLANAREAVEQLRSALEEGLAHCQRLQVQTFAAGMLFSGRDARQFEEVHTKISRCIELIAAAASVSTNAMVACKFEQGKQLESKLSGE